MYTCIETSLVFFTDETRSEAWIGWRKVLADTTGGVPMTIVKLNGARYVPDDWKVYTSLVSEIPGKTRPRGFKVIGKKGGRKLSVETIKSELEKIRPGYHSKTCKTQKPTGYSFDVGPLIVEFVPLGNKFIVKHDGKVIGTFKDKIAASDFARDRALDLLG